MEDRRQLESNAAIVNGSSGQAPRRKTWETPRIEDASIDTLTTGKDPGDVMEGEFPSKSGS
jgi:hypothetical protein